MTRVGVLVHGCEDKSEDTVLLLLRKEVSARSCDCVELLEALLQQAAAMEVSRELDLSLTVCPTRLASRPNHR